MLNEMTAVDDPPQNPADGAREDAPTSSRDSRRWIGGRVLAAASLLLLAAGSSGCCWTKELLGWTSYQVRIKADEDANYNGDTEVLIVWPTSLAHADFAAAEDLDEAKALLDEKRPGEDYEFAFFGTTERRDEKVYDEISDFSLDIQRPGSLTYPCDARRGFVYTTIGAGDREIVLDDERRPFEGYLHIHLKRDEVELSHFPTEEEWLRLSTRRYEE